jgi:hypothetical protein
MTDVVYDLFAQGGTAIAKGQTMFLPPWAGQAGNAEAVAAEICEVHLDEAAWAEHFFDSSRERVAVAISSPPEVAGHYRVEVVMRPKATATRVPDAASALRRGS